MAVITSIADADRVKRARAAIPVEFQVKQRLKLWVVLRDDIYSGSFPEEGSALQAAGREIQAILKAGGKAQMRCDDAI